jgi:hypothetical protein
MRRVPESYWQTHQDQRARVRTVAEALDPAETFDLLYAHVAEFLGRQRRATRAADSTGEPPFDGQHVPGSPCSGQAAKRHVLGFPEVLR